MKSPRDLKTSPQGGWKFQEPQTGKLFEASHPNVLLHDVWQHRISLPEKGMDVSGGWQERFWSEYCSQNEHVLCEDAEDKGSWIGMGDIWRYIHTLGDLVLSDEKTVPQEEAERRASICLTGAQGRPCPNNQYVDGCLGCKGAAKVIQAITGNKTTSKDSQLHACTACGCLLKIKIHLPLDTIHVDESRLPSFCWQRP